MPTYDALSALAARQHAMFTLDQASGCGVSRVAVGRMVQRGLVDVVGPSLYRFAGAPVTWTCQAMGATLWSDGLVSHRSAAALRGWDGSRRTLPIDVLVARWSRRLGPLEHAVVHETRDLRGVDVDAVGGIPCTSTARSLIDLCAVANPVVCAMALDHACRTTPGTIDIVYRRYLELKKRGRKGIRLMGRLLDERLGAGAFSASGFEAKTLALVRSIGLPEPVKQFEVRDGEFLAFIDLAWPDIKWGIECDSLAFHSGKRAHEWDRRRRRGLRLRGWELAEVTYDDVNLRPVPTGRELRELYELRRAAVLA